MVGLQESEDSWGSLSAMESVVPVHVAEYVAKSNDQKLIATHEEATISVLNRLITVILLPGTYFTATTGPTFCERGVEALRGNYSDSRLYS